MIQPITIDRKQAPKETCSIVLRPMELGDAPDLMAIRNGPDVRGVCVRNGDILSREKHDSWVANIVGNTGCCGWVVDRYLHGRSLGVVGSVSYARVEQYATIGLSVHPKTRRLGIGSRLILDTAHEAMETLGVSVVRALVRIENGASRMLFYKLMWENLGVGNFYGAKVEVHQYPSGAIL